MPIPELTADGYLPAGEFECELEEIETVFCGNEHRGWLMNRLREFLAWLRNQHGLNLPYYVDGSYTTAKEHPGDIDFVLDLSTASKPQINAALTLFTFHQTQIKENFNVDFWFYHPAAQKDLKQFFQYVRVEELQQRQLPPETRKGILRVQP
jgi:hypothetical protein